MQSKSILIEAHGLIQGDRQRAYGEPVENFARIAGMWTALFGEKLRPGQRFTAADVPLAMICLKLAREAHKHGRDNLRDACGYAALCQDLHEQMEGLRPRSPEAG